MENHHSCKQPMSQQHQRSMEHRKNNEHTRTSSFSFQDTHDDVNLTSTRTNSTLLSSAASNDVSLECQNHYDTLKNENTTNNKR